MLSYNIYIKGQVQGVGFRPFIYNLANKMCINGTVSNGTDGVHIQIGDTEKEIFDQFIHRILTEAPTRSKIISFDAKVTEHLSFNGFSIIHSEQKEDRNVHLSPDFGLCEDCQNELYDPNDRRYKYPFITCTQCGPRLSVVQDIPYDRERTTMAAFKMCPKCQDEYNDPKDRRYFSQTNSCHTCGVKLRISSNHDLPDIEALIYTDQALRNGKIVAVKGIGGYLLLCDASNAEVIETLRLRKNRPKKPFALLYPDQESIKQDVILGNEADDEIKNTAFPIILAYKKEKLYSKVQSELVAPGLSQFGVMLPNSPLLSLISYTFDGPLIATSANISGSPIIYDDTLAERQLASIADIILSHNRDIIMPQDDSVIRYSPFYKKKIIIRRSRGIAPTFWPSKEENLPPILCIGADMKSAFLLGNKDNIYISQFLGNQSTYDSQVTYENVLQHYLKLSGISPRIILRDKHPLYFFPKVANEFTEAKIISIQHHKAHFCAGLFENDLMGSKEPVLGIIWDGVGLGDDQRMWGGEFFIYEKSQISRIHFFKYFDYLLGDKMALQPRIAALSLCKNLKAADHILKHKFSNVEWTLYKKMLEKHSTIQTSSMGRIFDAIASLLGLSDVNSYEGESAMLLEDQAYRFYKHKGLDWNGCYIFEKEPEISLSIDTIMTGIIEDINEGLEVGMIAAKFHFTLVKMIENIIGKMSVKSLVFSGGVFQNGLLVDLIQHHLAGKYSLYFQKNVSPNDENIALGQMAYYLHMDDDQM